MVRLKLEVVFLGIFITSVAATELPSQHTDAKAKSRTRRQARPFQIGNISDTFPDLPFIPFAPRSGSPFRASRLRIPSVRRLSRFSSQFSRVLGARPARTFDQFPEIRRPSYRQPLVIRRIRLPTAIAALARRSQLRRQRISNRPSMTSGRRVISGPPRQVSSRRVLTGVRPSPAIRRGASASRQSRRPAMRQFQHRSNRRIQQTRTPQQQPRQQQQQQPRQQQQRRRQQQQRQRPSKRQQQRQQMSKRQPNKRQQQQQQRRTQQRKQQMTQQLPQEPQNQLQNPQEPEVIAIFSMDGLKNRGIDMLPGLDSLFSGSQSLPSGIGAVIDPSLPGGNFQDLPVIDGIPGAGMSGPGLLGPGQDPMYMIEHIPEAGPPPHFGASSFGMDPMPSHQASETALFDRPRPVTELHVPAVMKAAPSVKKIVPVTDTFPGPTSSKIVKKVDPVVTKTKTVVPTSDKISAPVVTKHSHTIKEVVPIVEKVVPVGKSSASSGVAHHDMGSAHPQSAPH